jgi:hypothetical protein
MDHGFISKLGNTAFSLAKACPPALALFGLDCAIGLAFSLSGLSMLASAVQPERRGLMKLQRQREWFWAIVAAMTPVHLAYWIGVRIMSHAAIKAFSETPTESITGLEALRVWSEAHVHRAKPVISQDRVRHRQRSTPAEGEIAVMPFADEPPVEEDPDQVRLVESVLLPNV